MSPVYPWPGLPRAVEAGCLCPTDDNRMRTSRNERGAWVEDDCPLHGVQSVAPTFVGKPWPEEPLR